MTGWFSESGCVWPQKWRNSVLHSTGEGQTPTAAAGYRERRRGEPSETAYLQSNKLLVCHVRVVVGSTSLNPKRKIGAVGVARKLENQHGIPRTSLWTQPRVPNEGVHPFVFHFLIFLCSPACPPKGAGIGSGSAAYIHETKIIPSAVFWSIFNTQLFFLPRARFLIKYTTICLYNI